MNVWGLTKKYLGIGMLVLPLTMTATLTGCLTEDDPDDPPANTGAALTAEKKDTIWNVQGPNRGAYNLVAGTQVAASDAATNKDIVDMAVVAGGVVNWPKTLNSLNGTMFVTAASGFDFAAATDSSLIKAYAAAGTPATATKVLEANDVILAKLRGGNTYAAIKVYAVNETSADNRDNIYFGYRLTP